MHACVCVSVCEKEREGERGRDGEDLHVRRYEKLPSEIEDPQLN